MSLADLCWEQHWDKSLFQAVPDTFWHISWGNKVTTMFVTRSSWSGVCVINTCSKCWVDMMLGSCDTSRTLMIASLLFWVAQILQEHNKQCHRLLTHINSHKYIQVHTHTHTHTHACTHTSLFVKNTLVKYWHLHVYRLCLKALVKHTSVHLSLHSKIPINFSPAHYKQWIPWQQ